MSKVSCVACYPKHLPIHFMSGDLARFILQICTVCLTWNVRTILVLAEHIRGSLGQAPQNLCQQLEQPDSRQRLGEQEFRGGMIGHMSQCMLMLMHVMITVCGMLRSHESTDNC